MTKTPSKNTPDAHQSRFHNEHDSTPMDNLQNEYGEPWEPSALFPALIVCGCIALGGIAIAAMLFWLYLF